MKFLGRGKIGVGNIKGKKYYGVTRGVISPSFWQILSRWFSPEQLAPAVFDEPIQVEACLSAERVCRHWMLWVRLPFTEQAERQALQLTGPESGPAREQCIMVAVARTREPL